MIHLVAPFLPNPRTVAAQGDRPRYALQAGLPVRKAAA